MLEIQLENISKNGKHTGIKSIFTDNRYTYRQNTDMTQVIMDQKFRHILLIKDALTNLDKFIHIKLDQHDVTDIELFRLIRALETYIGKIEYTKEKGKIEKAALNWLQENDAWSN